MPVLKMMNRLLSVVALLALSLMTLAGTAVARPLPAQIRLLEGGADGATTLAALEITLDPGYLTYWRTPGDAGIPPIFDWSTSENVANVTIEWPAPERVLEAGSVVYGFHRKVLLPLRVTPKQAGSPVALALKLEYGVCKEICIPATSTASLALRGVGEHALLVQQAFQNLPNKVALGEAAAPLAIVAIDKDAASGQKALDVTLRVPAGETAQLFAEGPEGWIYSTSEGQPGAVPGTTRFKLTLEAAGALDAASIRLTARAGSQAIETEYAPSWK